MSFVRLFIILSLLTLLSVLLLLALTLSVEHRCVNEVMRELLRYKAGLKVKFCDMLLCGCKF